LIIMLVWDVDRKRRTPLSDNQDRRLPIRAEPLAARSAPNGRTRRALGGSDALRAHPPFRAAARLMVFRENELRHLRLARLSGAHKRSFVKAAKHAQPGAALAEVDLQNHATNHALI